MSVGNSFIGEGVIITCVTDAIFCIPLHKNLKEFMIKIRSSRPGMCNLECGV